MNSKTRKISIILGVSILVALLLSNAMVIFAIIVTLIDSLTSGHMSDMPLAFSLARTIILGLGLSAVFVVVNKPTLPLKTKVFRTVSIIFITVFIEFIIPPVVYDILSMDKFETFGRILSAIRVFVYFGSLLLTIYIAKKIQKKNPDKTFISGLLYIFIGSIMSIAASAINYSNIAFYSAFSGLLFGLPLYLGFGIIIWKGWLEELEEKKEEAI